jgi:hypothetical protein
MRKFFKLMSKWLANITGETAVRKRVNAAMDEHTKFVLLLSDRQRAYYTGLHDSWRKELTRLEARVHELEQRKC